MLAFDADLSIGWSQRDEISRIMLDLMMHEGEGKHQKKN